MTPHTYRRLALTLCAVALAACGEGADAPAADASDLVADASAPPAATGENLFDTNFGQVCRGTGQPGAAAYAPGPGVHPVLFMQSDDGAEYMGSSVTLPEGWGAVWPELGRTELVACVQRVSAVPVEVCTGYKDDDDGLEWTVQTHSVVYEYVVRVAQTGEELTRRTFDVPAGDCPMFSMYTEGDPQPDPYYPSVGTGEVELFVRPFVTGAAPEGGAQGEASGSVPNAGGA